MVNSRQAKLSAPNYGSGKRVPFAHGGIPGRSAGVAPKAFGVSAARRGMAAANG